MHVACIQFNAKDNPANNAEALTRQVKNATRCGARLILTPECSDMMLADPKDKLNRAWVQGDHPTLKTMRALAKDLGIWLIIGSLAIKSTPDASKMHNRSFAITPEGDIAQTYDKIHLFDVALSESEIYRESDHYEAGDEAKIVEAQGATVGLTICYDIRFPALHNALAQKGANIITIPAAFTVPTGKAHWETLLRARAIETGCFILAAGQTGSYGHETGRACDIKHTYGHSMIINPWGEILSQMNAEEGFIDAEIDLSETTKVRGKIPSLIHGRDFT